MFLNISQIGQIALAVGDVDLAEEFYGDKLKLRKLYRFGDLTFFDCAGVRLMLEKARSPNDSAQASVIYFRCADIALAARELTARGVPFTSKPHLIAQMDDHDLWHGVLHRSRRAHVGADAGGAKGLCALPRIQLPVSGCGHWPLSIFAAAITAWVRLSTPSFCNIADTCALMVASETESS